MKKVVATHAAPGAISFAIGGRSRRVSGAGATFVFPFWSKRLNE